MVEGQRKNLMSDSGLFWNFRGRQCVVEGYCEILRVVVGCCRSLWDFLGC